MTEQTILIPVQSPMATPHDSQFAQSSTRVIDIQSLDPTIVNHSDLFNSGKYKIVLQITNSGKCQLDSNRTKSQSKGDFSGEGCWR